MSPPPDNLPFGSRLAQRFESSIDVPAFVAFNVFCAGWMIFQEWFPPYAFDPYPYEMLNMVVGFFMADVAIIISISQNAAKRSADRMNLRMLELMETNLAMLKTLRDMQEREEARDAVLHAMVQGGGKRGDILDALIVEAKA
ncbi:MAG: DUF1003 domain-containing protein [Acidobacteriaceae bacterium]